ncbi:MAG: NmrA family NAD(P)-binding protein [Sphingomonadaceae bacterium]|nr:NmrA family NAD(P)-binding protein [Sphingomonadaceae bacterium]
MASPVAPVLITGATGNVGREVTRALRQRGTPVRLAVREPDCADGVRFDFDDPASFAPALSGVKRVFLMRPPPVLNVKRTLNRFLDACAAEGVAHCVFLSVEGADKNRLVPHHGVERHLLGGRVPWTILRPGFFVQNLSGAYRADIREGHLVLPAGHAKVAYVDAADIGDVAALALDDRATHLGKAYHLTGSDSLSFDEVATMLTRILGRPVSYRAASLLGFWRHSRQRGIAVVPTLAYTIIHAALRSGGGAALDPTMARLLGRAPRTVEQFIKNNIALWT